MKSKDCFDAERFVRELFPVGTTFVYDERLFTVEISGKPTCPKGEPKTDVYIKASDNLGETKEFKISYKKSNAEFLENKINKERAKEILGDNWSEIISQATSEIEDIFYSRPTVYKKAGKRTEEGSITLGWKYEFLNKKSGDLSAEVNLTEEQIIDVYSGTHLDVTKRHAFIGNTVIADSGVANYFLMDDIGNFSTAQNVIDSIVSIDEYVKKEKPRIYFACKALNYRQKKANEKKKPYDGNRPLSVYIEWSKKNDVLHADFIFDKPLTNGGDYAYDQLWRAMSEEGISTTDYINEDNVDDSVKIFD